jgi:hypothetical protein
MADKSWDVIKEEAFKVKSLEEAEAFLHVAVCTEKELGEDLQKVKGAIVILKERITELKGALERSHLVNALRKKELNLGADADL